MDDQNKGAISDLAEIAFDTRFSHRIARLDGAVQDHLGEQLREFYGDPAATKLPKDLHRLANHLIQVIRAHTHPVDQAFIDGIMSSLPSLRAFALSLTRDGIRAEDLIQGTVLKAISRQELFVPGTNLQAWLFTVMRNENFTQWRSRRWEVEDVNGACAERLVSFPEQEGRLLGQEIEAALAQLSPDQRAVLLLVTVQGMPYQDAARALGCTMGTVKSRLNRARNRLAELLQLEQGDFGGGRASDR